MNFIYNKEKLKVFVNYDGWSPNFRQKRIANDNAEHILILSPSDSIVTCRYFYSNGVFHGECSVRSKVRNFNAKTSAQDFVSCTQLLKEDIMSRLNSWKQIRFFESAAESSYYDRVG